jgi:hypothetical protein
VSVMALALILFAALNPATVKAAWEEFERIIQLKSEPLRAWPLWILGVLGNRGVETVRLETLFLDPIHDPDETTRAYAVIGLGLLATDNSIAPLLNTFRNDPSRARRRGLRDRAIGSVPRGAAHKRRPRLT